MALLKEKYFITVLLFANFISLSTSPHFPFHSLEPMVRDLRAQQGDSIIIFCCVMSNFLELSQKCQQPLPSQDDHSHKDISMP